MNTDSFKASLSMCRRMFMYRVFIFAVLVGTVLTACERSASQATKSTPTPRTQLPQVKPVEIAMLNITSEAQSDGTVKDTANLSISSLGFGSLQMTSPATIKLGESGVIHLTITPDSVLTDLPRAGVPTKSATDPGYVFEFSDRLQIYPIMTAELMGVNFDIGSDGKPEKPVTSSLPVEWYWVVTPKSSGEQTLILEISIPVIIDQTRFTVSALTLKNIPIEIKVEVTATPLPTHTPSPTMTPTPLPVITRIGRQLTENAIGIVLAILGLITALVGLYAAYLKISKPPKGKPRKK
jgi:hypothetical protein